MNAPKIAIAVTIVVLFFVSFPRRTHSQSGTSAVAQYRAPSGWQRIQRDGAVVFTDTNKKEGRFCVLTIYDPTVGTGNSARDFENKWSELVSSKFKTEGNPNTETQAPNEGWQPTVGAGPMETDGVKAYAVLAVFSGFGKVVSVLAVFNDQVYLSQIDAFTQSIKLGNISSAAAPTGKPALDAAYLDFDPFPDKPHFQPQQPLLGRLRKSITAADIAGTWEVGGANVISYYSSGSYSHTDTTFSTKKYVIGADGAFESKFQGRTNNTTIREADTGVVELSGPFITIKGRQSPAMKYQFVAFMIDDKGGAVLTLIYVGDTAPLDGNSLRASCGHAHGFITCVSGEEWVRLPVSK